MFGHECEPCQQCKQRIVRCQLHLWFFFLDENIHIAKSWLQRKIINFVLPTSLKFWLQNKSATNVPEFKGRDETKGCNKRDILGETFVSGIPACALCLYPVKAVFAMFTVCNLQFALCVDPNSAFHPSHWPLSNCFLDNPPAAISLFVERMTSAQNHITLRCCICA